MKWNKSKNFFAVGDQSIRDSKMRRSQRNFFIHESTLSQTAEGEHRLARPSQLFSFRAASILVLIFLGILLGRVGYMQIIDADEYRSSAEGNRTQTEIIKAPRGVIYTADGKRLVKNVPNFTLSVQATAFPHETDPRYDSAFSWLEEHAQMDRSAILEALTASALNGQPVNVRERIPYEEALRLMIEVQQQSGVQLNTLFAREYMGTEAFSHILGYTAKLNEQEYERLRSERYLLNDTIGKTGVELSYESVLRGEDGRTEKEVNFAGKEQTILSETDAMPGHNVVLAIDSKLQQTLYDKLATAVTENDLPGGSAVAIDPRDGRVLALVSYPSYDNNAFVGGISTEDYKRLIEDERNPLYHRAISGEYPSGSTFKPVVAAAGLEEGVITSSTTVQSTGGLRIDQFFFPDWRAGGHGTTDVFKAIADSVNTFFYLLGGGDNETTTGLGVERIVEYGRKFGLAEKTGIDLPGERAGFLPSKAWKEEFKNEPWYLGDTYHLAIGQGDILVTPLQVAVYTAIIANGGTYYQPQIVDHVEDQAGSVSDAVDPVIKNEQVVSAQTINIVRQAMRETVLNGSARSLLQLPVSSAGKTGTAQFGPEDATHSWFTAFAPYETPEIAIAVIVEKGGGGNDTAVPIARETLSEYFSSGE